MKRRQFSLAVALLALILSPGALAQQEGSVLSPAPFVAQPTQTIVVQVPPPVVVQQHIVVQRASQPVATQPPRRWHHPYFSRPPIRQRGMGFGVRGVTMYEDLSDINRYGGGGSIRHNLGYRFATELAFDSTSSDFDVVMPLSLSGIVFFNTRGRLQPYFLTGFIATFTRAHHSDVTTTALGGHAGIGVELLLGRFLGISFDVRGFVQRSLIDEENVAHRGSREFDEPQYGTLLSTSFHFYFPRRNRGACGQT